MTTESITKKIFVMRGTQNSQDSRPHCTHPEKAKNSLTFNDPNHIKM